MKIINIVKEEISNYFINESTWYHGTPDNREYKKTGFQERIGNATIITDPEKDTELQAQMNAARKSGDEDMYFKLLDEKGKLMKNISYKKPIYFSNDTSVAKSYADPRRAFDYQNSEPSLITFEIDDNVKILKIPAYGKSFRGIETDIVKRVLLNDGNNEQEIDKRLNMLKNWTRNGKMSAETLSIITQLFGYDMVDVIGVLDSYHVGNTKSTIRMVFDPKYIREK